MIRFAMFLIVAACAAAGIGWLGEAGYAPLVVIHEGQQAVVSGPGEREQHFREAAIGFRVPFWSRATFFDTRLRVSDLEELPLRGSDDTLSVQLWWRISEGPRFGAATPEGASPEGAVEALLAAPFSRALATTELADTLAAATATERLLSAVAARILEERGVTLVALRIAARRGVELMEAMRSVRQQERTALRREVREVGPRIRSESREGAAQIEAGALREAQVTRGRAEAEAARIYAEAHSEAPEFFTFTRHLEAYRKTLGPGTTLVLSPEHEFFRLLSPSGVEPRP